MVRDQQAPSPLKFDTAPPPSDHQTEPLHLQESLYNHPYHPINEVSPSVGTSTENAYPYEADYTSTGMTPQDSSSSAQQPPWSGFESFSSDVQDWSLDQLYNFENMQSIEAILGNRRVVQEYDESGNRFAGF